LDLTIGPGQDEDSNKYRIHLPNWYVHKSIEDNTIFYHGVGAGSFKACNLQVTKKWKMEHSLMVASWHQAKPSQANKPGSLTYQKSTK